MLRQLPALTLQLFVISVMCSWAQLNSSANKQTDALVGALQGTIHSSRNEPVKDVRLELVPVGGFKGQIASTYSAPDGSFEFSNLSYGKYILTATLGLVVTSEDVDISSNEDWVSIGIDVGAASTDATVSVSELTVPSKASKALEKARHAVRLNKLEDADRYIAKALLAWPHYCQALTLKATLALTRNSFEQARSDAEKAVEYDPNDGSAYRVLGETYLSLNRLDDALRAIDRSIDIKPNAWQGYYEKGKILLIHRDWAGTLQQATKAASLKTEDDPYLHLMKALAFAGMNDRPAASNEVDAFRRLKPESSWSPKIKQQLDEMGMPAIEHSDRSAPSGKSHANLP